MQNKMTTSDISGTVHTSTSPQRHRCEDKPGFRSRFGITCAEHANVRCEALQVLGWTQDEVNDLLHNCPSTCAVPDCNDSTSSNAANHFLQPPTAAPTLNTIMTSGALDLPHDASTASEADITIEASRTLLRKKKEEEEEDTAKACYPRWPASCQDDPTYMSRMSVGCSAFQVFNNCFEAKTIVAFSDDEISELISRCPCTCRIQCTEAPTPAPFTLPPVGPMFNEVAAATAAAQRGSEGDSTDTLMTIIISVGGAVAFFVLSLAIAFVVTRARSKRDSFPEEEDGQSDTSDLSDEFYEQDDESSSGISRQKKKKRKKKQPEEKKASCMADMCPDIDLCI